MAWLFGRQHPEVIISYDYGLDTIGQPVETSYCRCGAIALSGSDACAQCAIMLERKNKRFEALEKSRQRSWNQTQRFSERSER